MQFHIFKENRLIEGVLCIFVVYCLKMNVFNLGNLFKEFYFIYIKVHFGKNRKYIL